LTLTPVSWVNGAIKASSAAAIAPVDRGFLLGDGAFETIRVAARRALWLDEHLARLRNAAALLEIPFDAELAAIESVIGALLERGGYADAAVRMTLTRGIARSAGLWTADEMAAPTLVLTCLPLPKRSAVTAVIARTTCRNERSPLSQIKSLGYGDNLIARREAIARGAQEGIMLNAAGRVACATAGNVFVLLADRWTTPPLAEGALPGLARRRLLAALPAEEREICEADLGNATAAFVSNSLGCSMLTSLGRPLSNDPVGVVDQLYVVPSA